MKHLEVLNTAEKLSSNIKISQDVVLLGLQHLTPTTVELFKRLIKKGLKPENIHLMGKCYSANPINFYRLSELGINVSERSFYFNSHQSYDKTLEENAFTFFQETALSIDFSKCKKVILLDDGATLLSLASQLLPEEVEVVGIEQTSAGYHRAKKSQLPFPIINVARSKAKLDYETEFVTRVVCRKVKEHMEEIPFKVENVLILGSGYIGRGIHRYLESNFNVDLFDPKHSSNKDRKDLSHYQLIIGCSGENSLTLEELNSIKHEVALMSASSSDREFPALELRLELEEYHYFSRNIFVNNIYLVNSGFPINFDDHYLDSYEFELTRSLLYIGVMQGISKSYPKKHQFEEVMYQEEIITSYLEKYQNSQKDPLCVNRSIHEVSFPIVYKLIRGLSRDSFRDLKQRVQNKFEETPVHFTAFGKK